MTHPRYRPARAIRWLAGAVLLFGGIAAADRLDRDPVERFRQALILEKGDNFRNPLKGESLEKALAFRKKNLEETAERVVSLSDLSRALLLPDWPLINAELADDNEDGKGVKKDKDDEKFPEIAKEPKNFDIESRRIVTSVRAKLANRFNKGISAVLSSPGSSEVAKVAVANLVRETIIKASIQDDITKEEKKGAPKKKSRLVDDIDFKAFAEHLSKLTTVSNARVEVSIAGALGQFREQPKIVAPALKRLLASDRSEATRLAASVALLNLSSSISSQLSLRGSEPGVTPPELTPFSRIEDPKKILDTVKAVTDAASLGLGDTSVAVRRQCITAMRNIAGEVTEALPILTGKPLPPRERKERSAEEIADIRAEHLALDTALEPVTSSLDDYSKSYSAALGAAVRDSDATVRIEARRTLRELARVRQKIRNLREEIPEDESKPEDKPGPKEKGKETDKDGPKGKETDKAKPKTEDDLSRRTPTEEGTIRLTAGTNASRPQTLPILPPLPRALLLKQAPAAKSDGITNMLDEIGAGLIADGVRDPNEKVRRASHEAIESLGYDAAKYTPELAKSLEDSDLFVRWITARILRKIAEEDARRAAEEDARRAAEDARGGKKDVRPDKEAARPDKEAARRAEDDARRRKVSQYAEQVIPALIKGLKDEDLSGRIAFTRALGAYGPAAKSAVPALAKLLGKGDAEYRVVVLKALEGIGEESQTALPEVVAAFDNTDPRVRVEAARLVGRLHKFSSSRLDALEKLTRDPDLKVREAAGSAILVIQPN